LAIFVFSGIFKGEELVLFNIPEGNKRESPTSYMSITNHKYKSLEMAEEAELKAASQPPTGGKENKQPAKTTAGQSVAGAAELSEKIKAQGEKVRDLKTQKAAKV
jgi:hypothetical protein